MTIRVRPTLSFLAHLAANPGIKKARSIKVITIEPKDTIEFVNEAAHSNFDGYVEVLSPNGERKFSQNMIAGNRIIMHREGSRIAYIVDSVLGRKK